MPCNGSKACLKTTHFVICLYLLLSGMVVGIGVSAIVVLVALIVTIYIKCYRSVECGFFGCFSYGCGFMFNLGVRYSSEINVCNMLCVTSN